MQFGNEISGIVLLVLAIIAMFLGRYEKYSRLRRLSELGDLPLLERLLPKEVFLKQTSIGLTLLFLFFTCLALARPQWGFTFRETTKRGVDIAIAFDVSESMRTEDVSPSRVERARREVFDLLGRLRGDRVGLVSFAGAAFIETPMTLDYSALKQFVSALTIGSVPLQGTNIELAVRRSLEMLGVKKDEPMSKRSRAILLITDGEALDGDLKKTASLLKQSGTSLYILGVGTPTGGPIPIEGGLKQDGRGQTVISKLNEPALAEFAKSVGGLYVPETATDADIRAIYENGIKRHLAEDILTGVSSRIWNEYFQIPIAFAIFVLLFGVWRETDFRKSSSRAVLLILFTLFLNPTARAQVPSPIETHKAEGKARFERGDFEGALKEFELAKDPNDPADFERQLAMGATLYRLKRFKEAEEVFHAATEHAKSKSNQAEALYNTGNSEVQLGKYQEAVTTYREALKQSPTDREIQENLQYAEKLLKQQQEEEEKKKDQEQKQDEQKDKQDSKQKSDQPEKGAKDKNDAEQESKNEQEKQEQTDPKQNQKDSSDKQPSPQGGSTATPSPSPQPSANPSPSPSEGEGEDEQQNQQNQGEGKPTPEPSPSPSPEGTPKGKGDEKEDESGDGDSSQPEGEPTPDEQASKKPLTADEQALETLLQSVEEKYSPEPLYRLHEALRQLEQLKQAPPEKDW